MRNWLKWDWEDIGDKAGIASVFYGMMCFLIPLGFVHYHEGMGPDIEIQPKRFLLDWVSIFVYYCFFAALGVLFGLLFWLLLMLLFVLTVPPMQKWTLSIDQYGGYSFLAGFGGMLTFVLYRHLAFGMSYEAIYFGYTIMPLLSGLLLFELWALVLTPFRFIFRKRITE